MLPPTLDHIRLDVTLFEHAVGTPELTKVEAIRQGEPLVINVGTAVSSGVVTAARGDMGEIALKKPVCARPGSRAAINRRIAGRWRLIGYGIIAE